MTKNNKMASFAALGPSNHSNGERADHDFYATPPKAVRMLLEKEQFSHHIWEPAGRNETYRKRA